MNTTKEPMPSSRQLLFPGIAASLETLATTLDTIAEPHHSAGQELAAWIAAKQWWPVDHRGLHGEFCGAACSGH